MKMLNFKNCIISTFSVGCLIIIIAILSIIYAYNKISNNKPSANNEDVTHVNNKEKEIKYTVGMIADSENDWKSMQNGIDLLVEKNVDYIIHLGDLTHLGVLDDLKQTKESLEASEKPYYAVPGDRDLWKSNGSRNFVDVFDKNYQAVAFKGDYFLLIDNSDEYRGIDEVQMRFIDDELAKAKFVILHNPLEKSEGLFGSKMMGQYSEEVDGQRQLLLEKIRNSNVNAVFAGDQHIFSETLDSKDKSLMHYVIGSINTKRSLLPTVGILKVYTDGDYSIEKIIIQ